MPRYYCDYCDTYLTHDSPSVRKQHNSGYKHKANIRAYYQQFEQQQTQSLIDQKIKEHLGQSTVYQQVGAVYNQHLASFPGSPQRPRLPLLPPPMVQIPGAGPSPMFPGIRPPVLPRPGTPGYGVAPMMAPGMGQVPGMGQAPGMGQPPAASSLPMQLNSLPRPPTMNAPTTVPGGLPAPGSNGAPSAVTQTVYQANPTTGSAASSTSTAADNYAYAQASEAGR